LHNNYPLPTQKQKQASACKTASQIGAHHQTQSAVATDHLTGSKIVNTEPLPSTDDTVISP
jgi:hypothetical protein